MSALGARLDAVRADERRRWLLTAGAVVLGLALAWVHWLGFAVGGALVALPQRSLARGLLVGLGFGALALLAFAAWLATAGALDTYLAMGQVLAVSVAIPLAGGLLGSLARGLR
ncbi:MAG: hypothetical protein ABEJ31_11890 [Haloarculaceae archaeon]